MDLIFFDLDGTLLNSESEISPFTKDTLALLRENNIAYTVATGRNMLSAQRIVEGHDFDLPHIYNNGVIIWDPKTQQLALDNLLDHTEVSRIIDVALTRGIAPFVNVIDNHHHFMFHAETRHDVEKELVEKYFSSTEAKCLPLEMLPIDSHVTNISMIAPENVVHQMWRQLNTHESLIAYAGPAIEGKGFWWLDVHHCNANKGSGVTHLKNRLGATNVICFGDGDNDLSMFELADESYAPENAKTEIKKLANAVIGHNHKDGIAHFLRERFML